ncbi:hypothetical protein COMA1_11548 [Candidatus Nitrospira nitrosa]|uniref:Uncharacterized protein n=1 Tax=Candidatus Nitrospira nitrosa TaxID=1742972 RepID=A0A0S4L8W5_9BACT|nr:hypothetical protein COMA1_11548 [Candidatus Nitrospira nitrosa]
MDRQDYAKGQEALSRGFPRGQMRVTLVGSKQVGTLRNTSLEGFSMVS